MRRCHRAVRQRRAVNYLGSKRSLLPFIESTLHDLRGDSPGSLIDLFAGTSAVGAHFKARGWQVTANEWQHYGYLRAVALIGVSTPPPFGGLCTALPGLAACPVVDRLAAVCRHLDALPPAPGYIWAHYAHGGAEANGRQYFSDENAQRIDAVRAEISRWNDEGMLTHAEYCVLVAALLAAADRVANTASVYAAYLKHLKASARRPIVIRPLPVVPGPVGTVHCADANDVAPSVRAEVCYLDPPYNARQYATNYHLLETIARGDQPTPRGKTGLRAAPEYRSAYSSRRSAARALTELVETIDAEWIVLSYNNEGIISPEQIADLFARRGAYGSVSRPYGRFRAERDGPGRQYRGDDVREYLHYVHVAR